jgi:hypothetical protein
VINYYPKYSDEPESKGYSDYCRVKLMLYHPFVDWLDLYIVDRHDYGSYVAAFRACYMHHTHLEDFFIDLKPEEDKAELSDKEDESVVDLDKEDALPLADFEAFARQKPYEDTT